MRISDWSSDVCSSDLLGAFAHRREQRLGFQRFALEPSGAFVGRRKERKGGSPKAFHLPQPFPARIPKRGEAIGIADPVEGSAPDARAALDFFGAAVGRVAARGADRRTVIVRKAGHPAKATIGRRSGGERWGPTG